MEKFGARLSHGHGSHGHVAPENGLRSVSKTWKNVCYKAKKFANCKQLHGLVERKIRQLLSKGVEFFSMLASGRKAQSQNPPSGGDSTGGRGAARYEVLERRGEGALWIVYRVRERAPKNGGAPKSGEMLALKALKTVANRHPRLSSALAQNARQWASLSHPNLATPRDVGVEDDTLYFTTRWLGAPSLDARLSRGALPAPEALRVLHGVAGALEYLHGQNLPHGDVRPRQIGFDGDAPILTDGGVAQAFADAGLALADVQGEVAQYLAPERSQGEKLSAPADIYALGVLFYRMICGRVPFDGASALAIAARHRTDAPDLPSSINPRLSADMDELALQLLDKNPANRPTAAQLSAMLQPQAARALENSAPLLTPDTANFATTDDEELLDVAQPRRRPLDEVVAETMAQEADEKRAQNIKQARRKHKWREFSGAIGALLWLLIMGGAVVGAVYAGYNYWVAQSPQEVVVPRYIGQSSESARKLLAGKGLKMKVTRESYDPQKPEGTVLAGEPTPGRKVRSQREVLVTVSAGTAPIKMVDFSKLSLAQARSIILQHGLRLGQTIPQFHPVVPNGYICGQYPESGEALRRSEPITLIVSRGPQPTDIDAQSGAGMPDSDIIDPSNNSNDTADALPDDGVNFSPLEPASKAQPPKTNDDDNNAPAPTATPSNELKTRRATIRVNIPSGGGRQEVRIVVRDSKGERTVYQRSRAAGSSVSRRVSATRPDSDPALVRVYVGDELVREENL